MEWRKVNIMFDSRRLSYILLVINALLIAMIIGRAQSDEIPHHDKNLPPLEVRRMAQPDIYDVDTLTLLDFESERERDNVYDQGGEYKLSLSDAVKSHGRHGLRIEKVHASNCEFAIAYFPWRWDGFNRLELDIFNPSEDTGTVWIRVGDNFDSERFYIGSQKYARAFALAPGPNTIRIQLDDIRAAFGYMPQRKSLHFNFPANTGYEYVMDYVRLVR